MTSESIQSPVPARLRIKSLLRRFGILPLVLILIVLFFGLQEPRFLSVQNLSNVLRQSTYLILLSLGQMIVLVTGGFDLSMASTLALVSVTSATTIAITLHSVDSVSLAIGLGIVAGLGVGALVGLANGIGVALLRVSPFMMTLGTTSVAFGLALVYAGASPIYGLPDAFGEIFGYGRLLNIPVPVLYTAAAIVILQIFLTRTVLGRHIFAVGSSERAARLSGVRVQMCLLTAYMVSGLLSAIAGILLTARTGTGEATLGGQAMVLQSVAACAIGGVSLSGGTGRLGNVVLGAIFIALIANGMNLIRVGSYGQQIAIGVVLIGAIVVEEVRQRWLGTS